MAGFDLRWLSLRDIPGRAVVDDIATTINWYNFDSEVYPAVRAESCDQVVVARSYLRPEYTDASHGRAGILAIGSNVTVVGSTVFGGRGAGNGAYEGGPGVHATDGSQVTVAGCPRVRGGDGWGFLFCGCAGRPGPAIEADNSAVIVTGSTFDRLETGLPDWDIPEPGFVILAHDSGIVVHGGVTVVDPESILVYTAGVVSELALPRPYVEVSGGLSSEPITIAAFGKSGSRLLLGAALLPWFGELPGWEGPVWIDVNALIALVPIVLKGKDSPVRLVAETPTDPAAFGLPIHLQGFSSLRSTLDPTKNMTTNAATVLIR